MHTSQKLLVLALAAAFAQPALAADRYWACGSSWWDYTCWSATQGGAATLGQPQHGDAVYLKQSDATHRIVSYWNTAYPSAKLLSLTLDATGAGTMTFQQSVAHPLAAAMEYIGVVGTGTFTQTAGSNDVTNSLYLGFNTGGNGTYNLDGTASLSAGAEYIGHSGTGSFNHAAGSNATGMLVLGTSAGASGSYTLNGSGSLSANSQFVGYGGSGSFTQASGSNTASGTLYLGYSAGGSGSYTLNGGTLNVGGIADGAGASAFHLNGGSLNVTGNAVTLDTFKIGSAQNANASFEIRAGQTVTVTDEYIGNAFNTNGTGAVTQSGGSHGVNWLQLGDYGTGSASYTQTAGTTTANVLWVGVGSNGSYTLAGGDLIVNDEKLATNGGTGTFNQTGGNHTIANSLRLAYVGGSHATYNLGAGTLITQALDFGQGTGVFNQSGGGHGVVADMTFSALGTNSVYTLLGGGLMVGGAIIDSSTTGATLNLDGGLLTVGMGSGNITITRLNVGSASGRVGSHTQAGGITTVTGNLALGNVAGASGSYTLNGGLLTAYNLLTGAGLLTVNAGSATFSGSVFNNNGTGASALVVNGGGVTVGADFYNGSVGNAGSIIVNGGSLHVGNELQNGAASSVTLNGGSLHVVSTLRDKAGAGTLTINGGTLRASGIDVANLVLGQAAGADLSFSLSATGLHQGANTVADWLVVGNSLTLGGDGIGSFVQESVAFSLGTLAIVNGAYTLNGGNLAINDRFSNAGSFFLNAGSVAVAGAGGLVNTGWLQQSGGNLVLSNTGANGNAGTWQLAAGRQLQLNGATLSNTGTFNLNGGAVTGTGSFANLAGGTLTGTGSVTSTFSNAGSLVVDAGTTSISKAFSNSGVIQLGANGANLAGGAIANSGRIEGFGKVASAVNNTGTVEAMGGTLTLAGGFSNSGTLAAGGGARLLVTSGLASNAGQIQLAGGSFDNNGVALTNAAGASISGYGALRTGGLSNNGQVQLSGGTSAVYGNVTSNAASKVILSGNSNTTFYGTVDIKSGAELRVSAGSAATFFGQVLQRSGALFSGAGSKFYEGGLSVGASPGLGLDGGSVGFGFGSEYLAEIGGTGLGDAAGNGLEFDRYVVAGSLTLGGTLKLVSWNNYVAQAGDSYDLFDWGSLAGQFDTIDSNGFLLAAGTRLDTSRLYLDGTISIAAVPEPETYALMLAGLGLVSLARRRARQSAAVA